MIKGFTLWSKEYIGLVFASLAHIDRCFYEFGWIEANSVLLHLNDASNEF
jgi:hypothetical protein